MNFNENELFGAALIGFDLIDGPVVRWTKSLQSSKSSLNLDDFAMNFYLAFRGGNGGKKPRAILYDDFYIVAFPKDLELCCLFMKPQGVEQNITQLNKIASRMIMDMQTDEDCADNNDEDEVEETKRLIQNILNDNEMSTPELRKYFKLSNAQIWKLMSGLENTQKVKRTKKQDRVVYWTSI
jgi:hypothetical protein